MTNKFLKLACVYALALNVLPCTQALANNQDVVVTKDSTYVMTENGDCVRTKWDAETDKCRTDTKTSIAAMIMQMDERIVYFDFDKSVLKDSEKAKLDVVIDLLKAHNVRAVKIVGFTDKIGTAAYNQALSRHRAEAVKHYINSKMKLDRSVVQLRALGEQHQVKDCKGISNRVELIECLAPNRRVEVEVDYVTTVVKNVKKKKR